MFTSASRSRWAAIGAAIAVTLGAGGIGVTHAITDSGERPIYLPIEPCRLADLRPAPDQVGPRSGPLGAGEKYDLSGWGSVGDCALPSDTAGLALNVTALGATLPTFLALFPADAADIPNASNLNPVPGQPPTPNAVNVDLDATGMFSIYNLQGNVNVIIDVVGVYDDHHHDDRYYTEAETYSQAEVDAALADKADTADRVEILYAEIGPGGAVFGDVEHRLVSSQRNSVGSYTLTFDRNIGDCVVAATDIIFANVREVSVEASATDVEIVVRDAAGVLADTGFYTTVLCGPETIGAAALDKTLHADDQSATQND